MRTIDSRFTLFSGLLALALGAAALAGCSDPGPIRATAAVDPCALGQALHSSGIAVTPVGLKGRYGAACRLHGGDAFGLPLSGAPGSLEVAAGESPASCSLLLTTLQLSPTPPDGPRIDFELAPPIALSAAYAPRASVANSPMPAGSTAFFANARLLQPAPGASGAPLVVEVVYAADPAVCGGLSVPPAQYARYGVAGPSAAIAPPNYEIDASSVVSVVDADAVVQSASFGSVVLWLPSSRPQAGDELKILQADVRPDSFEQIDAAYRAAGDAQALDGLDRIALPYARFRLTGQTLPQTRTLVARHTDGASGVVSYEVLRILFPPPRG
ncbi:MAG: hypothetical protein U1A78_17300 [Polyangia bacterium]